MSSDIARVHYFDRQYLRLDEFVDEQAYHLVAHRRHNLAHHHPWGIVGGLELCLDETGRPAVEPGFAVDGYGRDLVLDAAQPVPVTAFDELGSEEIAVWIVYDRFGSDRAPEGYAGCDRSAAAADFYREQERPRIVTDVPDPDAFDPRAPETVPEADRDFGPHRTPPDAVTDDWPVFLGRVTRDAADPSNPTYALDLKDRPYAGAVAASLTAPFDRERPRLLLGGDLGSDTAAFRVMVPGADGGLDPALEIDPAGALTAHGEVAVRGDLDLDGGVLEFSVARPAGLEPSPDPGAPQPWRIYRHHQEAAEAAAVDPVTGTEIPAQAIGEQLRIEAADSGEVVIGVFSEDDGAFKPCLTVGSEGTVTVHGNLVVEGSIAGVIAESNPRILSGLSDEARRLVLASFSSGVAGANLFLDRGGVFATVPIPMAMRSGAAAAPSAAAMAAALAADPDRLEAFAAAMRAAGGDAAARLASLLGNGDGGGG
jgi:hypothetical protein